MPSTRIAFPEIQSWTPAIEAKAVENGSLFVISGKNYYFDSKGPKSGFGSFRYSPDVLDDGIYPLDSITFNNRTIVFAESGAFENRFKIYETTNTEQLLDREWYRLATWESLRLANAELQNWTQAYVGYTSYVCFPQRGILRLDNDSLSTYAVAGAPEEPIAIIENNGRLVILDRFTLTYSAPFDGEDLAPQIGGAGFQVIAELIPGTPIGLVPFENGFYVFTNAGAIIAQYVGGDVVYRFDRLDTQEIPLSNSAWVQLIDGGSAFLTKQGLRRSLPTGGFEEIAPLFNEYFRREIATGELVIKLAYAMELDMLFIQIMDGSGFFNRTLVLRVRLDKWGSFDEYHRGVIRISSNADHIGYVDLDGRVHEFAFDSGFREDTYGTALPLDAKIELGFIRPASDGRSADVEFEIQEVLVSNGLKQTVEVTNVDLNTNFNFVSYTDGLYQSRDDWNRYGINDFILDLNLPGDAEDENLLSSSEDYDQNDSVIGPVNFDWNGSGAAEDWNLTPEGGVNDRPTIDLMEPGYDHDYDHQQAWLNQFNYGIEVVSNLDGWEEELSVIPALAVETPGTDLWTLLSAGHNHRLIFSASELGQKFHTNTLEITVHYFGQIS